MTTAETTQMKIARNKLIAAATTLLEEHRAIPIEEFEGLMLAGFGGQLPKGDMTGKRRSKALNEIDWVKAKLTERNQTIYVEIGERRLILWLPQRGTWDGVGFMNRNEAIRSLRAIAQAFGE